MADTPVQPLHEEEPFSIFPSIDDNPSNSTFVPNQGSSEFLPGSSNGTAEIDDIEYYTISGTRPYFDMVLSKSHVEHPFRVNLPTRMLAELPSELVPMVLNSCGKRWETFFHGHGSTKRFGWKRFVMDNDLKMGDCCFFELMECSKKKIEFKVIILRGSLPFDEGPGDGDTPDTAIFIE